MSTSASASRAWWLPVLLTLAVWFLYNANGREIDVGDSIPTRLAAGELLVHGTFALDDAVARDPELEGWPSVVHGADGHFRSAYPWLPAVWAAAVGGILGAAGLVDVRSPLGLSLVAKLTASLVTALGVLFAFFAARTRTTGRGAVAVAAAFGLGTGLWPTASQTLWQHETAIAGLMGAVWLLERERRSFGQVQVFALLLGLAGSARPQVAPVVAMLAVLAVIQSEHRWRAILAMWPLALMAAVSLGLNVSWYGNPLGPKPSLVAADAAEHMVGSSFSRTPWIGLAGLLFSPNRGLLIFSPVVAVAAAGFGAGRGGGRSAQRIRWFAAAAAAHLAVFSFYSIWWGGYTFGPRYLLDALPMLVPLGAESLAAIRAGAALRWLAIVLLAWSVGVSAVGAFCYSPTVWNTDPEDVDIQHERLWDWRDLEIVYCAKAGFQDDNFKLFGRPAAPSSTPGPEDPNRP